eukprot:gnl/MRDRNA2_/MRDRNA2_91557_c0_seq1.p1 gnl/MRDRNA2_/MRDRNA2_91557_c0~~gnl/MRDRNA2_/MRDRNA2_91557_c0_seq1.p1  ORF type:complete len:163 (+),score=24.47 gnl/MRDRNA2_/MRDRNA2_91557_c0_seq1:84-572(+)
MVTIHFFVFGCLALVEPRLATGHLQIKRTPQGDPHPKSVVAFARAHANAPLEDQDFLTDYPDKHVEDKLPEQGYTRNHSRADNPRVHHENWESTTADWGQEYGEEQHHHGSGPTETHGPDYPSQNSTSPRKPKPPAQSYSHQIFTTSLVQVAVALMTFCSFQ